jgi:hypothetical protein
MQQAEKIEVPMRGQVELPNGCMLYWQPNGVGGREYLSDEVGPGVIVWDTAITDPSTLLAALTMEATLSKKEAINKERGYE